MNEYLFIGGCANGKRFRTDGSPSCKVPVPSSHPHKGLKFSTALTVETHDYEAHRLHDDIRVYQVYVIKGFNVGVITALIEGYGRAVK